MKKKMGIVVLVLGFVVLQAQIISAQTNPNRQLMDAVYAGNLSGVQRAVSSGANVNDLNSEPLRMAAMYGHLQIVRYLVENGADPNLRNSSMYSQTPLIGAASKGHIDIVIYLVENGARVNLRNKEGSTAASIAYDEGEIEIYNYLKENGAIDFEPRQVAQQPAAPAQSTTNVYVQPTVPSQPSVSVTPTLRAGTYVCSGTNHTMTLTRISDTSGSFTYTIGGMAGGVGTYRISGNYLTLSFTSLAHDALKGKAFSYNITSDTSFTLANEVWVRK
jgi:hypothetical protein